MTRIRSTRRMRNRSRSRSRSKRGGVLRIFQSEEMKEFTDILRDNVVIKDGNYMGDGFTNFFTLFKRHSQLEKQIRIKKLLFGEDPDANPSFIKLKNFWSGLTSKQKDMLKEELSKANKKFLYEGVVDILESENISPAAPAAPAGDNASSQVEKLLPKQAGGSSRRHRRSRRTNKNRKSRKGRKMRRSYK
jgi:hypothetical protein